MPAERSTARLFELHPDAGPAVRAWEVQAAELIDRDVIDPIRDALLIAHVASLARRLDNPTERAYGLAQVSRELRDVYTDLEGRAARAASAGPDPLEALALDSAGD